MKITHVVNVLETSNSVQHRLLLGKHLLAEGMERFGTEAEIHLDACFKMYVAAEKAKENAAKQAKREAEQAQGALPLK